MPPNSQIAFLGLAERTTLSEQMGTARWNLLGLKTFLLSNFFPINLASTYFVFAIKSDFIVETIKIVVRSESGHEVGKMTLTLTSPDPARGGTEVVNSDTQTANAQSSEDSRARFVIPFSSWTILSARLPTQHFLLNSAEHFQTIRVHDDGSEEPIGAFQGVLVDPPPLTPERVAAIRSDPMAAKAIRIQLGCNNCRSKVSTYAALERSEKIEADGHTWYELLPETFTCDCGGTSIDLRSIRRNLHGPIGNVRTSDLSIDGIVPLYEANALEVLLSNFRRLLDQQPHEEVLQKFIEDNPILLCQFPAEKLFFKPAILTFFKADFALVTPQKELIFIEIETAKTRLLRKDGGQTSDLRHAFDQVLSWLHIVDEHRLAVLECLGIPPKSVSLVRGVVIAGRDGGYDADHLRRFRGVDHGRITFLTFDDLAFGLSTLTSRMKQL